MRFRRRASGCSQLFPDELERALQGRRSCRRQLFRGLDAGGLDLDRDRPLRQRAEPRRDLEHEVDPDIAGDGVADRALHLGRIPGPVRDDPSQHRAGRAAADDGADEDQQLGLQVLEPLRNGDRAIVELLDEDARPEVIGREPLDGTPTEIEIALKELADPADEDARAETLVCEGAHVKSFGPRGPCANQSAPQAHVFTSRTTVPCPVWTWVVHGMQGSKLRIVRSMSIEVNFDGSEVSSMIGVFSTASS